MRIWLICAKNPEPTVSREGMGMGREWCSVRPFTRTQTYRFQCRDTRRPNAMSSRNLTVSKWRWIMCHLSCRFFQCGRCPNICVMVCQSIVIVLLSCCPQCGGMQMAPCISCPGIPALSCAHFPRQAPCLRLKSFLSHPDNKDRPVSPRSTQKAAAPR